MSPLRKVRRSENSHERTESKTVGGTHGRIKDEYATLKLLNINTIKVQPLRGCNLYFISFPPVLPVVIQI